MYENEKTIKDVYARFYESKEFKELCECCNVEVTIDESGHIVSFDGDEKDISFIQEQIEKSVEELESDKDIDIDAFDGNGIILAMGTTERKYSRSAGIMNEILFKSNHGTQYSTPGTLDALLNVKGEEMERDLEDARMQDKIKKAKEDKEKVEMEARLKRELLKLPPSERLKFMDKLNVEDSLAEAKKEVEKYENKDVDDDDFDISVRRTWY